MANNKHFKLVAGDEWEYLVARDRSCCAVCLELIEWLVDDCDSGNPALVAECCGQTYRLKPLTVTVEVGSANSDED